MSFAVMGDESAKGIADLKAQIHLSPTTHAGSAQQTEEQVKAYKL